jgi:hypothetical protein
MKSVQERFWIKVNKNGPIQPNMSTPCWEWLASVNSSGYGHIRVDGKLVETHRLIWEWTFGLLGPGECALHKCDFRRCVNPEHLFKGTTADNNQDMWNKGRYNAPGQRGEKNGQSKLTMEKVREIRRMCKIRARTQAEIGKMFGVSAATVSAVYRNLIWKE